jgi:SGNH hydrolase-like domain, acetyltransferase AlgX
VKWLFRLLILAQFVIALVIIQHWLYVTTYRLYVEDRIDSANESGLVSQQFNIVGKTVVPQIFTEGTARLKFAVNVSRPAVLWVNATPSGQASYEIGTLEKGSRRLLAQRTLEGPALDGVSLPAYDGTLEITSHGVVTWSDLRIERSSGLTSYFIEFAILVVFSFLVGRVRPSDSRVPRTGRRPMLLFMGIAIVGSCVLSVLLLEGAIRLIGPPSSIGTIRRELGEVTQDPQWEDSPRYGMRLRPNQDSVLSWDDGDIVRMGFIPSTGEKQRNRYLLRTDAEGFRNAKVRDSIHVAALGDSFTDALTLPVDQIWTTGLEQRLGLSVQNYGTAGFGPQQELRVLTDYAIHHHPRVVLVAFFAGNDIFNAESFDKAEKAHGSLASPAAGWKIKKIVARYDTLYSFSLLRLALDTMRKRGQQTATNDAAAAGMGNENETDASVGGGPAAPHHVATFERGMFTIPINHRKLRFALMPPYLRTLTFSAAKLERYAGWQLTRSTLLQMNRVSRDHGATLVVLFIPFKSQVHLPLLERSFSRKDLEEAFRFYFRQDPTDFNLKEMADNRLAQNELMRRFCDQEHILLIDPTEALQRQIESGRNMYFPTDAHWNASGHELAAGMVADFLKQHGLNRNNE